MLSPVLFLLCVTGVLASPPPGDANGNSVHDAQRPMNGPPVAFYNPADRGGTMFDNTGNGLGEPLNVRHTL